MQAKFIKVICLSLVAFAWLGGTRAYATTLDADITTAVALGAGAGASSVNPAGTTIEAAGSVDVGPTVVLTVNAPLIVKGTLTLSSGTIKIVAGGSITAKAGATVHFTNGSVVFNGGSMSYSDALTFGGAGQTLTLKSQAAGQAPPDGILHATPGAGSIVNAGTLQLMGSADLRIGANSITNLGTIHAIGGGTWDFKAQIFHNENNTIIVDSGQKMRFTGDALTDTPPHTPIGANSVIGGTIENSGTLVFRGLYDIVLDDVSINNHPAATLVFRGKSYKWLTDGTAITNAAANGALAAGIIDWGLKGRGQVVCSSILPGRPLVTIANSGTIVLPGTMTHPFEHKNDWKLILNQAPIIADLPLDGQITNSGVIQGAGFLLASISDDSTGLMDAEPTTMEAEDDDDLPLPLAPHLGDTPDSGLITIGGTGGFGAGTSIFQVTLHDNGDGTFTYGQFASPQPLTIRGGTLKIVLDPATSTYPDSFPIIIGRSIVSDNPTARPFGFGTFTPAMPYQPNFPPHAVLSAPAPAPYTGYKAYYLYTTGP